jgi:predicted transcriptional regulator
MRMDKLSLTPCEVEVMKVVWNRDSVTVQDVLDVIPRELAYTTVMTTFRILEDKGFVTRIGKRGRALVYSPVVTRESASRSSLRDTADRFFDGSLKLMVFSLIKTKQITKDDLAKLRTVIDSVGD